MVTAKSVNSKKQPGKPPAVCYYISGHGFGHASRAAQVIARIPPEVPVIVKSTAPEDFIRKQACRPIRFVRAAFDFGAWQDSNFGINWDRTFEAAIRVQREAAEQVDAEAAFLRRENVRVVVSDVPSPPLRAARLAGIPGLCLVNFTWIEVMRKAAADKPERLELLHAYKRDYALATLALRTPFCLSMPYFPVTRDIPLIARRGKSVRDALRALGLPRHHRLVLVYFGNWGNDTLRLDRLRAYPGISFLSFSPVSPLIRSIAASDCAFADVVASVDAVFAKPGYGTMGECMANRTPVIYYPRPEFAEYPALRRDMVAWGGGVRIDKRAFLECRWHAALEEAFALNPKPVRCNGAGVAAGIVMKHFKQSG